MLIPKYLFHSIFPKNDLPFDDSSSKISSSIFHIHQLSILRYSSKDSVQIQKKDKIAGNYRA